MRVIHKAKLLLAIVVLSCAQTVFAGEPKCQVFGPFNDVFALIQKARSASTSQARIRHSIKIELERAEFFRVLPGKVRRDLVEALTMRRSTPVRETVQEVLQDYEIGMEELEAQFNPDRKVELTVDRLSAADIYELKQTVFIYTEDGRNIKSGVGRFFVQGEELEIPIIIKSVEYRRKLHQLEAKHFLELGPEIARLYTKKGANEAESKLISRIRMLNPQYQWKTDLITVIHFERLSH